MLGGVILGLMVVSVGIEYPGPGLTRRQGCLSGQCPMDGLMLSRSGWTRTIPGARPAGGVPPSQSSILTIGRTREVSHQPLTAI